MSLAQALARRRLVEPSGPSGAVIEGDYRYLLWRDVVPDADRPAWLLGWPERWSVLFVMLNPSVADEVDPDPTLTRCMGFAASWGCRRLEVVNLFAAIETDPKCLARFDDPVGPKADAYIRAAVGRADAVVCAWGAHRGTEPERRASEVRQLLPAPTFCLGVTDGGHPRHPLYLPKNTPLSTYTMRAR